MDNSSVGTGFMAVFAVSGSVVFLAHQIHKRVLSDFMKKFEFELVESKVKNPKKKVRFEDDAARPLNSKVQGRTIMEHDPRSPVVGRELEAMPLNRQVLYKGIIQFKGLKGQYI